jgi:hypothetical protein
MITPQCLSPTFFPIVESLAQAEKSYNPHAKELKYSHDAMISHKVIPL